MAYYKILTFFDDIPVTWGDEITLNSDDYSSGTLRNNIKFNWDNDAQGRLVAGTDGTTDHRVLFQVGGGTAYPVRVVTNFNSGSYVNLKTANAGYTPPVSTKGRAPIFNGRILKQSGIGYTPSFFHCFLAGISDDLKTDAYGSYYELSMTAGAKFMTSDADIISSGGIFASRGWNNNSVPDDRPHGSIGLIFLSAATGAIREYDIDQDGTRVANGILYATNLYNTDALVFVNSFLGANFNSSKLIEKNKGLAQFINSSLEMNRKSIAYVSRDSNYDVACVGGGVGNIDSGIALSIPPITDTDLMVAPAIVLCSPSHAKLTGFMGEYTGSGSTLIEDWRTNVVLQEH